MMGPRLWCFPTAIFPKITCRCRQCWLLVPCTSTWSTRRLDCVWPWWWIRVSLMRCITIVCWQPMAPMPCAPIWRTRRFSSSALTASWTTPCRRARSLANMSRLWVKACSRCSQRWESALCRVTREPRSPRQSVCQRRSSMCASLAHRRVLVVLTSRSSERRTSDFTTVDFPSRWSQRITCCRHWRRAVNTTTVRTRMQRRT
mmetsp:Transcript_12779/g.28357  ORF Transcript_12779/g.28357 Transcript_12779/m.28357 type:complete len:202 (+) Transcript_12779:2073-2678(+)